MAKSTAVEQRQLRSMIGRSIDGLTLQRRWEISGLWVATELYSPQSLPLRVVEAIGTSANECIQQLRERGLDPSLFEYEPVPQPYPS